MMKNSKTIGSRVDNLTYDLFEQYCKKNKKTISQVIHRLVVDLVKKDVRIKLEQLESMLDIESKYNCVITNKKEILNDL